MCYIVLQTNTNNMRQTMTVSLPTDLLKEVEQGVKQGGFATKSEFIRDLVRSWKGAHFLKVLEKSELEFKQGKGRVLKSLKDLR